MDRQEAKTAKLNRIKSPEKWKVFLDVFRNKIPRFESKRFIFLGELGVLAVKRMVE